MKIHRFFYVYFVAFILLLGCGSKDGFSPSLEDYSALQINPEAIIVPKSTTFKITVYGVKSFGSDDITSKAQCHPSQSVVAIDGVGNLSNTYTGTQIQRLNITCSYNDLTVTVPITIVPAVLTSIVFTKNNIQMNSSASENVQVYGNFTDANNYVFALELTNYVTWTTNQPTIASATGGVVHSTGVGSATLTATLGAISGALNITANSSTSTASYVPTGVGLLGSYYDFATGAPWSNSTIGDPFETLFGQRIDSQVYFNWSTGTNNLGQPLYFGIRWTGRVYIPTTGAYTFYTQSDDGVRLWIDDVSGNPVIDNWTLHATDEDVSSSIQLTGGQFYNIRMDYFENAGYSQAELRWSGPSIAKQLIPQIYLFPN